MLDLSVIITSCDKYSHLLQQFTKRFDKYWEPGDKYPKFITTETVKIELPGYTPIITEEVNWSNSLLKALEQVKTRYTFLIFDDFFLIRTLSNEHINRGLKILKENNFDKYVFHYPHEVFNGRLDPTEFGSNIYKVQQGTEYIMTVQPGIWNTEFLRECIKKGESPWQFEIEGSVRVNETKAHNIYMEVAEPFHKEAMSRGEFTPAYFEMTKTDNRKKILFLMKIKEDNSNNYTPAIFNWYGILERLGYEVFYEDYSAYNPDTFYQLVKENKPDYIFHPTYEGLHTEFTRLREFSKVYCIHSDDDWRFESYIKFWLPFTDGAIGYQNNKTTYLAEGVSENYYHRARWAFNPNTMYFKFSGNKSYELSHVGGLHGNKLQRVNELKSKGLNIELIDPKFTDYSAYLEAYSKSVASICLTGNSLNAAPQSKTRLAEMPFYCPLVSEAWPDMELWNMEPNKDFILIDQSENYLNLIDKLIKDKDYANKMYQSGKEVLINSNTVFHEWNRIMQSIDEDYKPVDVNQIIKTYNLI